MVKVEEGTFAKIDAQPEKKVIFSKLVSRSGKSNNKFESIVRKRVLP